VQLPMSASIDEVETWARSMPSEVEIVDALASLDGRFSSMSMEDQFRVRRALIPIAELLAEWTYARVGQAAGRTVTLPNAAKRRLWFSGERQWGWSMALDHLAQILHSDIHSGRLPAVRACIHLVASRCVDASYEEFQPLYDFPWLVRAGVPHRFAEEGDRALVDAVWKHAAKDAWLVALLPGLGAGASVALVDRALAAIENARHDATAGGSRLTWPRSYAPACRVLSMVMRRTLSAWHLHEAMIRKPRSRRLELSRRVAEARAFLVDEPSWQARDIIAEELHAASRNDSWPVGVDDVAWARSHGGMIFFRRTTPGQKRILRVDAPEHGGRFFVGLGEQRGGVERTQECGSAAEAVDLFADAGRTA
jgi:hypothetical protein